ncbi:MAG TPA: hypothetical protein VKT72_09320 [Candidatus Baltobacteraceae bacterium]|nr:hypothetical protein [Candidatus Baltobacteraceae bacterium]
MSRLAAAALFVCALAACAPHARSVPRNVAFGGAPVLAAPPVERSDAPPRIVSMWFSSDDARRGERWSGTIIASTNVASVEVRTNLFSIDVPRRGYGDFRFTLHVFDVPPIFIRPYNLRVIARNSAGESVEEDLPFRIR